MKKSVFRIESRDSQTGDITEHEIPEEEILLYVNDSLYDSIDKGDTIKITVLENRQSNDLYKAIAYFFKGRGSWAKKC